MQKNGYDADKMWDLAKQTYEISKNQTWPYIRNPSPRIRELLGTTAQAEERERHRYKRMERSRNLKQIKKMMSTRSKNKTAYAFKKNLKTLLTHSTHENN